MLSKELTQSQIDVLLNARANYQKKFYRTSPDSAEETKVFDSLVELLLMEERIVDEYYLTNAGIDKSESIATRIRFSLARDHYFSLNTPLVDGINIPAHGDDEQDVEEIILKNGWKIQITPHGIYNYKPDVPDDEGNTDKATGYITAGSVDFLEPI